MPGKVFNEVLDIAREQHGFVRTTDLRELGLDPKRLNDYRRRGLAERVGYGVYRLVHIPPGERDEYMHAAMWPDGRGVLSHETALDLHDLCDVNPNHIDITIPKAYRTHRQVPRSYRLHPANLPPGEVTSLEGLPIVTAARAITECIGAGLRPTLVNQAIDTSERQAMITAATAGSLRALGDQVVHCR